MRRSGQPSISLDLARLRLGVLLLCVAGCTPPTRHEVKRPSLPEAAEQDALQEILGRLQSEKTRLEQALPGVRERSGAALQNLRHQLGDEFEQLMETDSLGISLFASQNPGCHAALAELALHAEHLAALESRIWLLDLVIREGESAQRIAKNHQAAGAPPLRDPRTEARLQAVLDQGVELPTSVSPEEVANAVAMELANERIRREQEAQDRLAAEERESAERDAALAQQAAAEQRARLEQEAEVSEAKRRAKEIAAQHAASRVEAENQARALKLYADAYHAYFRNQLSAAERLLSDAIALSPGDARFHYFRGLARHRMGQLDAAEEDFRLGGEAERQGSFEIGRALERVQGAERVMLERYRP